MKKKVKITNTHRYTKQKNIQYNGYVDFEEKNDGYTFTFREKDGTKVRMNVYEYYMQIERFGEATTFLTLRKDVVTKNPIKSMYGVFEIDIYTYSYEWSTNYIKVEYDVENGSDDKDGFIIEIEIKEGRNEFH